MAFCDFVVKYDRFKDTNEDITKKILYTLILKRLKYRKPTVIGMFGDSGEGKSWGCLRVQEMLCQMQKLELSQIVHDINVYTPLEYPKKLENLLFPKKTCQDTSKQKSLKYANILAVHEARTIVKAKNWHSFTSQAISDVNAMSRSIKRICFMIVSQFIRDITTDVRYTLTYYCKVSRPLGCKTRLYWNVMWKDDRDLEKPKLRKRGLSGYLVNPKGQYRHFIPQYFELSRPNKEITKVFEEREFESKGKIIHRLMQKMIKEMEIEASVGSEKIESMVDWYSKNTEHLSTIGKTTTTGKWRFKPEIKKMHELTSDEFKEFSFKMNEKLNNIIKKEDGAI